MERIRQEITRWAEGRSATELAARAAGVVVIAVVPGALAAWVAYRLIRARVG
jgi:molecular chaperone DnaK (HSP70)